MNTKKKGNRIELQMAKLLTKISGIKFNRVGVCSGARHTKENINANGFIGDIFTEDKKHSKLVIEVKGTKKPILLTDIFNNKSLLSNYIEQCKRESNNQDWLLIVKVNGRTPFFICENNTHIVVNGVNEDIVLKYPDIFKNSIPISFGRFWLGELK
jgi:hypothetical protein